MPKKELLHALSHTNREQLNQLPTYVLRNSSYYLRVNEITTKPTLKYHRNIIIIFKYQLPTCRADPEEGDNPRALSW